MIDRLEELLASLEDEAEEEQENRAELGSEEAVSAPPALKRGAEKKEAPEEQVGERAEIERKRQEPEEHRQERQRDEQGPRLREAEAGADEAGPARESTEGLPWDGTVWSAAGRGQSLETPLPGAGGGLSPEPPGGTEERPAAAEWSLEGLYRKTRQVGQAAAPVLPAERPAVRGGPAEQSAGLTVDELDRAVRRDSRRYDGGMSIY